MARVRGGDRIEKALGDLASKLQAPAKVRIGFLEESKYPNGTSVAMIAAIQEFGAPSRGIPARPFFRNMIAAKKGEWPEAIKTTLKDTNYDVDLTLRKVGEAVSGQLIENIRNTNEPPLSPVTLMLRKMFPVGSAGVQSYKDVQMALDRVAAGDSSAGVSTKPLIWTGRLIDSVNFEVKSS